MGRTNTEGWFVLRLLTRACELFDNSPHRKCVVHREDAVHGNCTRNPKTTHG
ncbi:hypothetical protein DPMN_009178 [Dreissena polymorpha]|uniref:Uncharacterized protein n=1 Tax=Dreissena polymorpha TaxID=45954 RepID=A0A9D4MWG4_DREPO|nr:hypothetical protein DPMN_009178 [Dreissena polymorpha]